MGGNFPNLVKGISQEPAAKVIFNDDVLKAFSLPVETTQE